VKFEGLKGVAESVILEALPKEEIDLREGRVYDPVKVKTAISVIRKVLESSGQRDVDVEVHIESLTATCVVLTFVIKGK
jgi:outer membrane protein assembly factor BamA